MVPGIGRSRMNSIAQTAEKLIMNIHHEPVLSSGGRDFKKVLNTISTNEHLFTESQTNTSQQKVKMLSDIMNQIEKQDRKSFKHDGYRKSTFIKHTAISNTSNSETLKLLDDKILQDPKYLASLSLLK